MGGGYYELINHTTSVPTPDYWVLYLWRQHVGNLVFNSSLALANETASWTAHAEYEGELDWNLVGDDILEQVRESYDAEAETYVRGYAFAAKESVADYLLVLLNFHLWDAATVDVAIQNAQGRKYEYGYDEFHIVGIGADGLKTKQIEINGARMQYEGGQFPTYEA